MRIVLGLGFLEETKLRRVHQGDLAIELLGGRSANLTAGPRQHLACIADTNTPRARESAPWVES